MLFEFLAGVWRVLRAFWQVCVASPGMVWKIRGGLRARVARKPKHQNNKKQVAIGTSRKVLGVRALGLRAYGFRGFTLRA